MQEIAEECDGWIGTFGAGPEALPVYLKRGYAVRAGRRWVYSPMEGSVAGGRGAARPKGLGSEEARLHSAESLPSAEWMAYRYRRHPRYRYEIRTGGVFRTEDNEWGTVTHACHLGANWQADAAEVYCEGSARAGRRGAPYMMDAWGFERPGPGWTLAPEELPSVFHPPEARGNVIYSVGRPFVVTQVHKGDCDQDRPNEAGEVAAGETPAAALVN